MAKKLKIGIILDTSLDTNEGVPQYVACIGQWLAKNGNEVHYLVGQTEKRQLPNIHSLSRNISVKFNGNVTTIPLPTSRRRLRRFMRANKFDILYVQTPHHPLLAQRLILAAPKETAVVGLFHILPYGWLAKVGTRALGLWLAPSLKRIDKMLAVSQAAANFEKKSFGLDAEVMPNVFDYPAFKSAKPLKKYQDNKKTILFLGRLVERKGCQVLLEAVAKLARDTGAPEFRVVICGRGALEAKLKSYAEQAGIGGLVEFAGYVSEEDKPKYYASADIAVFPSSAGESFGIVLLEAMASGKTAVLAGDNPGYRSVMLPQPELLFRPKDHLQLAEKIKQILNDDKLRNKYAKWGSAYTANFDVDKVGKELLAVFHETLRKRRGL